LREKTKDIYDTDLTDIMEEKEASRRNKFKNKLRLLQRYQDLFPYIPVTEDIKNFIGQLILWLKNEPLKGFDPLITTSGAILNNPDIKEDEEGGSINHLQIADEKSFQYSITNRIVLTSKDTILQGKFVFDQIQDGKVDALFSNAEYYNGDYKGKFKIIPTILDGMKSGKGTHYYLPKHINLLKDNTQSIFNYNIYNGEFIGISQILN